jgi:hypothetical protein
MDLVWNLGIDYLKAYCWMTVCSMSNVLLIKIDTTIHCQLKKKNLGIPYFRNMTLRRLEIGSWSLKEILCYLVSNPITTVQWLNQLHAKSWNSQAEHCTFEGNIRTIKTRSLYKHLRRSKYRELAAILLPSWTLCKTVCFTLYNM